MTEAGAKRHTRSKLVGIQWGRGIAALLVVVCHSIAHPYPEAPDFAHIMGRVGVTMFFIISGFIMVTTTSSGEGRFDPALFMRKRITRIVPLYWSVTLLVAVLSIVVPAIFKSTPFDFGHVLTSLFFIPSYAPDSLSIEPFYKLGWTLNYEMFFYVVFAGLFWMNTRVRTVTIIALFSLLFLLGLVVRSDNPAFILYTRTDILAFAIGAAVATFQPKGGWRLTRAVQASIVVFGLVGLALMLANYPGNQYSVGMQLAATVVCTGFVIVLACYTSTESRPGNALLLLGDASYAIYLFHMFAVAGTWWLVGRAGIDVTTAVRIGVMLLATAGATVLGVAVYQWFERPIARLVGVRPAPRAAATTP